MNTASNNPQLNEQQLDMIRLLRKPLPKEYFMQIKRLAVQLLGKQLDDTMGKWEEENNVKNTQFRQPASPQSHADFKIMRPKR